MLQAAGPVEAAYLYKDRIFVRYITGLKTNYTFRKLRRHHFTKRITEADSRCQWPVPITYEHTWNPFDVDEKERLSKYFFIPRSTIDSLSLIEKDLLVHHILDIVMRLGYIRPYITEAVIQAELRRIHNLESPYGTRPARPLYEHYCDISRRCDRRYSMTLANAFTNNKMMFVALQRLINNTKYDLSITGIHSILYSTNYGPRWRNPILVAETLRKLFGNGERILFDATPNLNEKMFVAWALGHKYASIDGSALPPDLLARMQLEVTTAAKPYDLAVIDRPRRTDDIVAFRKDCKDLVVFASKRQATELAAIMKPWKMMRDKMAHGAVVRYVLAYRTETGPQKYNRIWR